MPNTIRSKAGDVHGEDLKRKEGQQQAQAAGHARKNAARVPELDGQAEHAEREQQIRNLRMGDRTEKPLPP